MQLLVLLNVHHELATKYKGAAYARKAVFLQTPCSGVSVSFLPSPAPFPVSPAAGWSAKDTAPERSPCQGVGKMAGVTGLVEDQCLALFYFTNQIAQVAALVLL